MAFSGAVGTVVPRARPDVNTRQPATTVVAPSVVMQRPTNPHARDESRVPISLQSQAGQSVTLGQVRAQQTQSPLSAQTVVRQPAATVTSSPDVRQQTQIPFMTAAQFQKVQADFRQVDAAVKRMNEEQYGVVPPHSMNESRPSHTGTPVSVVGEKTLKVKAQAQAQGNSRPGIPLSAHDRVAGQTVILGQARAQQAQFPLSAQTTVQQPAATVVPRPDVHTKSQVQFTHQIHVPTSTSKHSHTNPTVSQANFATVPQPILQPSQQQRTQQQHIHHATQSVFEQATFVPNTHAPRHNYKTEYGTQIPRPVSATSTAFRVEIDAGSAQTAKIPGPNQRHNSPRQENDPVRTVKVIRTPVSNSGFNALFTIFAVCVTVCVVAFCVFAFFPILL